MTVQRFLGFGQILSQRLQLLRPARLVGKDRLGGIFFQRVNVLAVLINPLLDFVERFGDGGFAAFSAVMCCSLV